MESAGVKLVGLRSAESRKAFEAVECRLVGVDNLASQRSKGGPGSTGLLSSSLFGGVNSEILVFVDTVMVLVVSRSADLSLLGGSPTALYI